MSKTKFKPTDEQLNCLDIFSTGAPMKIVAGAGTGKSSTLGLLGESTARRGLYLVFDKGGQLAAVDRMPKNVEPRTAHSVARRAVVGNSDFATKLTRLTAKITAAGVGLDRPLDIGFVDIPVHTVAYYLMDWVDRFSASADSKIGIGTAPLEPIVQWLTTEDSGLPSKEAVLSVQQMLLPMVNKLWAQMTDFKSDFPATHDTYLKLWSMSNPMLDKYDFIMYDEAQDANPAILSVITQQPIQQIYVGDPNQQIYSWRGAINAMETIVTDETANLSQSFRFGRGIAEQANLALDLCQSPFRIKGAGSGDPTHGSAILCRTNSGVISVMDRYKDLSKVHIAGGTKNITKLLDAMSELRSKGSTHHPDLVNFQSWADFVAYTKEQKSDLTNILKITNGGSAIEKTKAMLSSTSQEGKSADVTLSTAHKSKGLEWSHVELHDDFKVPDEKGWSSEEARLLYVAVTRPMKTLRLPEKIAMALINGNQEAPGMLNGEDEVVPMRNRAEKELCAFPG